MRKRLLISLGACLSVVGVVVTFVSTGTAGSKNICTTPSDLTKNPPVYASCVQELVLPHFISSASNAADSTTWSTAISSTKFTNQSGVGGATATHVTVGVTWPVAPSLVVIKTTTVFVNGVQISNPDSICSTTSTSTTTTRTCSVGNIDGGGSAKVNVVFATNTSMNTQSTLITGSATFGESGNDNTGGPNGTVNDKQSSQDFLTVGTGTFQGGCFTSPTSTVSGSTPTQITKATVGQAAGLPCTPVDAGVDPSAPLPSSFTQKESFVEFPALVGGAVGSVVVDFLNKLPKTFVLYELTNPANPTALSSWTKILSCGQPTTLDTCISGTKTLAGGGTEYALSVKGSLFDPKVGG